MCLSHTYIGGLIPQSDMKLSISYSFRCLGCLGVLVVYNCYYCYYFFYYYYYYLLLLLSRLTMIDDRPYERSPEWDCCSITHSFFCFLKKAFSDTML